jgi:calcineurin-like phosphoesterase family protein
VRALIVADLHGNIEAVAALETWIGGQTPFDAIWVLGDLVGYGGAPAEVVDWVRRRVRGVRG